jgi:pyrrolidone-carboxylate peptidase
MKILITGFEKFGDYSENITEVICRKKKLGEHDLESIVFPVRIFANAADAYGKKIVQTAQAIGAHAIISLGMASDVFGVRIETRATNWVENKKYCLPSEQETVLDNRFAPSYTLRVNLGQRHLGKAILGLRDAGLVHEDSLSGDANNFCCNALIFRTLQALNELQCEISYLFLHVSCSKEAVQGVKGFNERKHLTSVEELEKALLIFITSLY